MALIKCPECGRENVSDTAKACPGCGYGIKEHFDKIGRESKQESIEIKVDGKAPVVNRVESNHRQEPISNAAGKKVLFGVCAVLAMILVIVIIAGTLENAKKCKLDSCDNYKMEGKEYCKEHTCEEDGCSLLKSKSDRYCYKHEKEHLCEYSGCDEYRVDGGEYCYEHTCSESGCYNSKGYGSDYCIDHQVDMRERLTDSSFYFLLNSAGGIDFNFSARNSTGKEIKYVRFEVELRNAVGDLVQDEIKNTSSVSVEIVGPVEAGSMIYMSNEIIGYCDTCARISIDDITIIYTDDTSETGHFGYYYEY